MEPEITSMLLDNIVKHKESKQVAVFHLAKIVIIKCDIQLQDSINDYFNEVFEYEIIDDVLETTFDKSDKCNARSKASLSSRYVCFYYDYGIN